MSAKLVITKGERLGREHLLRKQTILLGRSAECDVASPGNNQVSRRHAQLELRANRWHVKDLSSINGTFVNDQRLAEDEEVRLRLGDRIRLGEAPEYTLMEAVGVEDSPLIPQPDSGFLPPQTEPARNGRAWWWAGGAVALIALLVGAALLARQGFGRDGAAIVSVGAAQATPGALPKVVTQRAPADLPPPTPKPTAQASAVATPANRAAAPQAAGAGAQKAAPQAASMSAAAAQLEQLPALIAQAFPGTPPDQLPGAIMQALQSGQFQPQAAQGFIQALFPGVPPAQLPAALAGSFAGFNIPQIEGILQGIYPGAALDMSRLTSREGAIVYAALNDAGDGMQIYQMNADGGDRKILIQNAGEPAFSPDGKRLAYYSSAPDAVGLRIRDMETSDTVNVTAGEGDAYPSWSPDGSHLALWDTNDNTIVVIGADGNGRRPIARGEFPDWSPRGDRIAYKGCVGNDCGIVLVNPDGANPTRITTNSNDGQPAWSPDGRSLAFVSNRDGNWEIYAVNADGSWLRRITNDPRTDGLPAWSADGLRIAFRSDRDGRWAIYTASGIGGPPSRLTDAPVQASGRWQWTWEQLSWR